MWHNVSVAVLNTTFQFLVIYRLMLCFSTHISCQLHFLKKKKKVASCKSVLFPSLGIENYQSFKTLIVSFHAKTISPITAISFVLYYSIAWNRNRKKFRDYTLQSVNCDICFFASESGILGWLLSLCLFSFFSHTSYCFTHLNKKREHTLIIVLSFGVENPVLSAFHSPITHRNREVYCQ